MFYDEPTSEAGILIHPIFIQTVLFPIFNTSIYCCKHINVTFTLNVLQQRKVIKRSKAYAQNDKTIMGTCPTVCTKVAAPYIQYATKHNLK